MLKFLKKIFTFEKIDAFLSAVFNFILIGIIGFVGFNLFYSIDYLSIIKYSTLILLSFSAYFYINNR